MVIECLDRFTVQLRNVFHGGERDYGELIDNLRKRKNADDSIPSTIKGQATLFGTTTGTVQLAVTGDPSLAATLAFTPPTGWGFPDGFPNLPPSYKHLSGNAGTRECTGNGGYPGG